MELGALVREQAAYELEFEVIRRRGQLLAEHYRLETAHGERPVAVEEGWFRDVAVLGWGGAIERYPSDVAPLVGCALMLRGLDFERGAERSVSIWLANSVHWEVALKVERRERVEVPAGAFEAWRVRARPSFHAIGGALDRIVGLLLPPFIVHFDAEPPHRFLRFAFPTGPFPWNPRAVIEATGL
ncbi:MAG: hypothetical protein ACJ760_01315 [Thermoleophilaceae bacterium]